MTAPKEKQSLPLAPILHSVVTGILLLMGFILWLSPRTLSFLFSSTAPRNMGEQSIGYLSTMGIVWFLLAAIAAFGAIYLLLKKPQGFPVYLIGLGLLLTGFLMTFQWLMAVIVIGIMVVAGSQRKQLTQKT